MRPLLLALAFLLAACSTSAPRFAAAPAGGPGALATAGYANPVIDEDFPDPMVLRARDGTYYAYGTQRFAEDRVFNVPVYQSRDLVHWKFLGDAMPEKPAWTRDTQNIWAPHVLEDGGRFYLYFSGERNGRRGHGVGVATASSPAGPFEGEPRYLAAGEGFENIDPMPFDDPATGKKYLYWGSGFRPIKVRELTEDRLRFKPGEARDVLPPADRPYERLIEGAWVVHRDGWYYLFYSGDDCCSDPPKYVTLVARSRSATGPFERLADATGEPDSVILGDGPRWKGTGHNAIVTDGAGQEWIVYHARDERRPFLPGGKAVRRPLLIDRLAWRDGWPVVADGRPSEGRRPAPTP